MEMALTQACGQSGEMVRLEGANALAALFEQYSVRITTYLTRMVGDRYQAEDLTQETFLKAYRALSDGRVIDRPLPWLYTIATNTALSALRRRRLLSFFSLQPFYNYSESVDDPESYAEREPVLVALGALSPDQRAVLLLCLHEGLSYEEAGRVLGVTGEVIKGRVFRARQAFIRSYRKSIGDSGR